MIMGNVRYCYAQNCVHIVGATIRELFDKGVPRKLSVAGLRSYLEYGCVYEPLTIVEGVRVMREGEKGARGEDDERGERGEDGERGEKDLVLRGVEAAVRRAMPERPAAYLSGGIDSSAVVAVMRRLTKEPIDTFCVIHEDPKCDEREWARMVAKANGTRHHEMLLTPAMIKANIRQALDDYDQPSLDGINNWFAAKMVKELGFDTVLSGNGGDELFVGYWDFAKQRMAYKYGNWLRHVPRSVGRLVERCGANEKVKKLGMLMGAKGDPYFQVRRVFSDSMIDRLIGSELSHAGAKVCAEELEALAAAAPKGDLINRISWLELQTSVRSMYVRDGWNMARAHGIEVRSPLLDPELVDLVLGIPGTEKLGSIPKHLLVEAAGEGLPMACVTRPKKGFSLPFNIYFREALKDEMDAFLSGELWDGLDKRTIQKLWKDYEAGKVWWTRIWGLFVLSYWIKKNGMNL